MKTIKAVRVNHLRIYPAEREVISAVSKTKGTRAGALVFAENLPASEGQTPTNVLQLSGKQLDNLASMHGIRSTGRKGWNQLAILIGVGKSAAFVSSEPHKKGDKYVDRDGVEQEYTQDSTSNNVDSVILPEKVTNALVENTIREIISWEDETASVAALLEGNIAAEKPL